MLISVKLLAKCVVITYTFGSVHEKFIFGILRSLTSFGVLKTLTGSADLKIVLQNMGRDPFNQTFRKFRSKTQWIGSVQPEKFRKNGSTF